MKRVVLLALALAACGCRDVAQELPGSWKGELEIAARVDPASRAMVESLGDPTLEIREGGAYRLMMGPLPVTGRWRVEGGELVLEPDSVGGRKVDGMIRAGSDPGRLTQKNRLKISADGKSLLADAPDGRTTFTKISSP